MVIFDPATRKIIWQYDGKGDKQRTPAIHRAQAACR